MLGDRAAGADALSNIELDAGLALILASEPVDALVSETLGSRCFSLSFVDPVVVAVVMDADALVVVPTVVEVVELSNKPE